MSSAVVNMALDLRVRDVTGERTFSVPRFALDATMGEFVNSVKDRMGLPASDSNGRPHVYRAFLEREARHVHSSETVGESLRRGDAIVLAPDVQAGRP